MNAIGAGAADELVPALAALAREHVLLGKPRDRFFRYATALLTELNADEAPWLRVLLERAVSTVPHKNITVFLLLNGMRLSEPDGGAPGAFVRRLEGRKHQRAKLGDIAHGYELLSLLKHHRIANEPLSGTWGARTGYGTAMLEAPGARRLADALRAGGVAIPDGLPPVGDWKEDQE